MSAPVTSPSATSASVTVLHVVAGGPDGEIRYLTSLTDGVLAAHEVHAEDVAGGASDGAAEPDVSLTTPYAEALAIARGELHPNVAFMRGRTKTSGPTGPLLAVLAAEPGEDYCAAVLAMLTATD